MTTQEYNAESVNLLATHFPKRDETSYAWGNAMSGLLCIARLRGLYGVSSDRTLHVYDHSGQGRTLTPSATYPNVGLFGITPAIEFTLANSTYLQRTDESDLEPVSYLTAWTWIKFHTESTTNAVVFWSKHLISGGQRSWSLWKDNAATNNQIRFRVSGDGTTASECSDGGVNYDTNRWFFIAGVYQSNTRVELYIGDGATGSWKSYKSPVGTIPNSIFDGTAPLRAGASSDNNSYLDGLMALFGWASYPCAEAVVWNMFQQTRPLYTTIGLY